MSLGPDLIQVSAYFRSKYALYLGVHLFGAEVE